MAKKDKLLSGAGEHLDNEEIEASIECSVETTIMGNDSVRNGILIATQRRVVFYAKKLGGFQMESFEYGKISSFEQGKNMMGATLTFFASGNKVAVKWIKDPDLPKFVEVVRRYTSHREEADPAPVAKPSQPSSGDKDPVTLLKQLGELKDAGLLTDAEFEEKRKALVARL